MTYRRLLLILEIDRDPAAAIATIRRIAPTAELLSVVARVGAPTIAWRSNLAPDALPPPVAAAVEALRAALAGAAATVELALAQTLDAGDLRELAAASAIDLVVAGPLRPDAVRAASQLATDRSLPVLHPAARPPHEAPIDEVVCAAFGVRGLRQLAEFLRDHGDRRLHATVLVPTAPSQRNLASILEVAGIQARVDIVTVPPPSIPSWIQGAAAERPIDLVVLAQVPGPLLSTVSWPAAVLALAAAARPPLRQPIDVADPVAESGSIRLRVDYALGVGRREPIPDQTVALVSAGQIVGRVDTRDGEAEIPADIEGDEFGIFRVAGQGNRDPLGAIETHATVVRPGRRPLALFDADLPTSDLIRLRTEAEAGGAEVLGVRLRPMRTCGAIRKRLAAAGITPLVVDASAVLDEGAALDVPRHVDPVRLARVGAKLRGAGFPVAGVVYKGPHPPATIGFDAIPADRVAGHQWRVESPAGGLESVDARLEATTGARLIAGNRVEIELDNPTARRWLLEGIAAATNRVHFQVYMAADDDVGSLVSEALAAAGARGVAVRVVVDSLHGLDGSFGLTNPVLERLRSSPGVELRVSRPITRPPSVEELKRRDHRKLVVFDGRLALLGGRNLSHEYYTGFSEIQLTRRSTWRAVPWLDAGARVEGPAVAELERSFLEAWTEAGGGPFAIESPPPAGPSSARIVVHHGLRDAATLDAYLALIDGATSHVYTVNGFPLALEIQHALLRALRRGVAVRTIFGNLTPTHGGKPFAGPWGTARTAATELVHSRMDPIAANGGQCHRFTVPEQPGWEVGLGAINPHVHAKVVSVDGRACAIGSANLDITAGYWESELMLLLEDPTAVAALEAKIHQIARESPPIDPNDPSWRRLAERRHWLRRWPGILSV
jgi:phosphatidylserine/phosphatidylglycerophosphate/cardiolipin synthase-like enzyme